MVDALGLLPCPSLIVQQTSIGQSWHSLSALTALTPELAVPRQLSRTQSLHANWFFYHRVTMEFIKALSSELLTTDYSSSGSSVGPHVHGLAWLPGTPDVEQLLVDNK